MESKANHKSLYEKLCSVVCELQKLLMHSVHYDSSLLLFKCHIKNLLANVRYTFVRCYFQRQFLLRVINLRCVMKCFTFTKKWKAKHLAWQ